MPAATRVSSTEARAIVATVAISSGPIPQKHAMKFSNISVSAKHTFSVCTGCRTAREGGSPRCAPDSSAAALRDLGVACSSLRRSEGRKVGDWRVLVRHITPGKSLAWSGRPSTISPQHGSFRDLCEWRYPHPRYVYPVPICGAGTAPARPSVLQVPRPQRPLDFARPSSVHEEGRSCGQAPSAVHRGKHQRTTLPHFRRTTRPNLCCSAANLSPEAACCSAS